MSGKKKIVNGNDVIEMIPRNSVITLEKDIWTLIEQMHLDFKTKHGEISMDEYLSRKVREPFFEMRERMKAAERNNQFAQAREQV